MKKYTEAEIDRARNYCRNKQFPEVTVNLSSRSFSFFIIPSKEGPPELPNFVMRCTGNPEEGYAFGISGDVKPEHRPFAVAHEFIEFMEIGIDTPNGCVGALEEELKLVSSELKPESLAEYLVMRRDFFRNLIPYCENHPEEYTNADISEFKQTLARLEEIVKSS